MIEVKNLVKKYGAHIAVDDLSFRVETGKIVGFLGPNGAGKSTAMNMITGYIAPTEGNILIDCVDIWKEPEAAKRKIGYLPEIPPLYPDMQVREYLLFVAELKKVPRDKRNAMVNEIMSRTKVLDVSERLIRHLSKGYKQRVGLAGAMMGYPDILVLDEPTVGLDPSQIIEIRDLIRELSKGHTILLSSHIMQEISAVCDEIIIINEGKMIACDTPEDLTMRISSNGIHLIIRGEHTRIKEALHTIPGIKKIVCDEETEEGTLGLTLYSVKDADIREAVFYTLAEADCPLLEMHHTETSLEDAFLALTRKETSGSVPVQESVIIDEDLEIEGSKEGTEQTQQPEKEEE